MVAPASDWLKHFPLLLWTEFNKSYLNDLYEVCVFRADRKNKMAALASDWPRHLRLPLWNRWTKFHDTWQEARSQRSLPSLCFCADQKNMVATPTSNSLRYFRLLWNCWMEFNKTWWEARCLRPLPSLCFSDRSEKQMAARCLIGWYIFDFSSDNAERNSAKRDKKQDLNVLYQVRVFFWTDQ